VTYRWRRFLPAGERCASKRRRTRPGLRPDGRAWEIEIVWRRDPWWQRWIRAWREDRQARLLAQLDPRILEDIGLGPGSGGSALMQYALAACDRDGMPAYLESTNPRNVRLYERHGFELLGTIQAGSSPPLFPMLREPRPRVWPGLRARGGARSHSSDRQR
jgi:GNAT superfamily N-acetyltransferase